MKSPRLDSSDLFVQTNEAVLEVAYHISLRIAECNESHVIGDDLMVETERVVFGKQRARNVIRYNFQSAQ